MPPPDNQRALFRPEPPPRNLTHAIAERIGNEITSGTLPPGTRLPTEQAMVQAMGVSRTVVREAVAALRADGLVITRQGAGVFVAGDAGRRPFRLAAAGSPSIAEILEIMELRAGIETEAAGLAATRAGLGARRRVRAALARIDAAIGRGEDAVAEDFAFHRAIAEATGNPQFPRFLEYLGHFIIPRQSIRVVAHRGEDQRAYLERIQGEHRAILAAIEAGGAEPARDAMRRHLVNSQDRYRRLAAAPGAAADAAPGPADRRRRRKTDL